jgi:hypothetical protein
MKTNILLVIFAVCLTASAQNKIPDFSYKSNGHQPAEKLIAKTPGIFGQLLPRPVPENRRDNLLEPIQIIDSVSTWEWNQINNQWSVYHRMNGFVYDASRNLTEYKEQAWNGTSAWVNLFYHIYTYDESGNETSHIIKDWNISIWVNSDQYIYAYDAQKNKVNELHMTWDGSTWVNGIQYSIAWDENGNETSYLCQYWSGSTWVNTYQDLYSYDARNNRTNYQDQTWNGTDWQNNYQEIYVYDINNNMTSSLAQNWNGTDWVNFSRDILTYDTFGNLTGDQTQIWNSGTSSWDDFRRCTSTYDASQNKIRDFYESWNGSTYINDFQTSFAYDNNGNPATRKEEIWDGVNWDMTAFYISVYDASSFLKDYSEKHFSNNGTVIDFGDSTHVYYHTNLAVNDLTAQDGTIGIYPNPAQGRIRITAPATGQITFFDLTGKEMLSLYAGKTETIVDLSSFPSGVYYIRWSGKNRVAYGTVIRK